MKALFLESVAGIAGDMFAASFVDAGLVRVDELQAIPGLLALEGVRVELSQPLRASMRTSHLDVKWDGEGWKKAFGGHEHKAGASGHHPHEHWHTHYVEVDRLLERSRLDSAVKSFARKVFRLLAEAEAQAHGVDVADVSFHEVGAVDSIVDVVMAALCVTKVSPERVLATPVKLGRGLVTMEHGTHPIPPPATARLVRGLPVAAVPSAIMRENIELSTPTGLAIVRALEPEFVDGVPAGVIQAQGMGSGSMDLGSYPNVFRVSVMELCGERAALAFEQDQVVEICCNIDDETPERVAWISEQMLEHGALDVWVTPLTGKKGRVALLLSVLAEPERWQGLADWLLRHSSTFGVRYRPWDRLKLARRFETRKTASGAEVRFKIGMTTDGQVIKEKPEYDDLKKIWVKDPDFRR